MASVRVEAPLILYVFFICTNDPRSPKFVRIATRYLLRISPSVHATLKTWLDFSCQLTLETIDSLRISMCSLAYHPEIYSSTHCAA